MTEEFLKIMADQDRVYTVCFMISTVIFCALELEQYFKRKNGDLTEMKNE